MKKNEKIFCFFFILILKLLIILIQNALKDKRIFESINNLINLKEFHLRVL